MEALVIGIIAGILYLTNVIPVGAFLGIILAGIVFMCAGVGLYFKFGFLKFYYHGVLGWHRPDGSPKWSDGLSTHSKCKYCGKDIMQDSQGNWF